MSKFDPKARIKTAGLWRYNLSYYSRLTSRMGDLVPVMCKKVVPRDRFKVAVNSITRLAPLANPVYDRLRVDFDAFYVQNRIIDSDFKSFITGGIGLAGEVSTEGMTNIVFNISSLSSSVATQINFGVGTLFDYLNFHGAHYGATTGQPEFVSAFSSADGFSFNAEPVLGYHKIYSDWYRNERFQNNSFVALSNRIINRRIEYVGSTSPVVNAIKDAFYLKSRNYAKDPYTTALAEPLIGGPVPLLADGLVQYQNAAGTSISQAFSVDSSGNVKTSGSGIIGSSGKFTLAQSVSNTVQALNQQYALYAFFMKDTYNGNRYTEFMESHHNVKIPDSTLERPIFLGRQTSYITFSEIFQTSASTGEDNALGDYTSKGSGVCSGSLFDYTFTEHGYIYVIMSIVPYSAYFQGIADIWSYGDRFELFSPEFQNIGDAPVYLREIYFDWSINQPKDTNDDTPFGYNRRNYNYIWYSDELHGNYLLDTQQFAWTFGRRFEDEPVLGDTFSKVPRINNPFVFTREDSMNFFTDLYFNISALRPIEKYETITTH